MDDLELFTTIEKRLDNEELVLPTLPDVAFEANEVLSQDDVEIRQVALIIKKDPAIAASVVRFANSALVRGNQKITSIEQATIRIGINRLKNVIITSAVAQIFFAKDISFALHLSSAWGQSKEVSINAGSTIRFLHNQGIAKHIDHDALFLTGLVHNIGLLPILTEADKIGIIKDRRFRDCEIISALMEKRGNLLTKKILQKWNFSEDIITPAHKWRDTSYNTDEISLIDLLRLGMTNTDVLSDDKKSLFQLAAEEKGLVEGKDWNKSKEFIESIDAYKDLF